MDIRTVVHKLYDGVGIQWTRASRYSDLCSFEKEGIRRVLKMPAIQALRAMDHRERESHARVINERTQRFVEALVDRELQVARDFSTQVLNGFPVHLSRYEGEDCRRQLEANSQSAPEIFASILRNLRPILLDEHPWMTGIDGRIENFAGPSGRYVDVFPPLIRFPDDGETIVHWPNPTDVEVMNLEVQRKFTAFGVLRRLRFDVLSMNPALEQFFFTAMRSELGSSSESLVEQFELLPDARVASDPPEAVIEFLKGLPPTEVDLRREIAVRLIPTGPNKLGQIDRVFCWTSSTIQKGPEEFARRLGEFEAFMEDLLYGYGYGD